AAAVHLGLRLRGGDVGPVDRRPRPWQGGRDGEAHTVARRAFALPEPGSGQDFVRALVEPARGDAQPVHRPRVRLDEVAPLHLYGVEVEVARDLLQVEL